MKRIIQFLSLGSVFLTLTLKAQNVGINSTGALPAPSAILDVSAAPSNDKGLLVPRIPLLATNNASPVTSPATSLLVYNTASASSGTTAVSPGFYYWDGSKWVRLQVTNSISQDWNLSGNSGTTAGTHFLGTTDAQDLVFKTNGTENMRFLNSNGFAGIGTNLPSSKLHVANGGITLTNNNTYSLLLAKTFGSGGHPSFIGMRGQGTDASPTYPLANDVLSSYIGRDVIDGLTATNYGGSQMYFNATENFSATNKGSNISFGTTPNGTSTVQQRMVIEQNGNVGINTTNPNSTLHINGSVSASIISVASNYTVTANDYSIVVTASGVTLSLPAAATCQGRIYNIVNLADYNSVTFNVPIITRVGFSTPSIGASSSSNYVYLGARAMIQSDGTNWIVISW